ncbi:MAG: hypothetical protein SGJ20_07390 [Planctomycetota bacterium]|nr:hypothetical protein [Planctomycetota bacterium]
MTSTSNPVFDRRHFLASAACSGAAMLGTNTSALGSPTLTCPDDVASGHYSAPSNAEVTGIDPNETVLFAFDEHWIPFRQSLCLTLEPPKLCDQNPVLGRGGEGEPDSFFASLYGTVIRQHDRFRMWYCAVDSLKEFHPGRTNMRLAYAESTDGTRWEKPNLGLREYRGSKDNNLCALDRECYNSPLILYEPEEPDRRRRFKMAFVGYHHQARPDMPLLCTAFSPDGLTWTEGANPVIDKNWSELSGIYRWNNIYYVNGQTSWPPENPKRSMINFASADFTHWQQPGSISFWRHDLNKRSSFNVAGSQVHLGASIWHRRNVLLGLYGQWEAPEGAQNPDVRMNLGLIISNDGVVFREPIPGFPFIPWGKERSDWKTIRLLQANAFVNYGDTTYIWYGGASDETGKSIAIENNAEVGLATLPRDRFGYLRPTAADAILISQELPASDGTVEIAVNVEGVDKFARLRIELLDGAFRPISGFSGEESGLVMESSLRSLVAWKRGTSATINGTYRIRVAFEGEQVENIKLYGIYALPKA